MGGAIFELVANRISGDLSHAGRADVSSVGLRGWRAAGGEWCKGLSGPGLLIQPDELIPEESRPVKLPIVLRHPRVDFSLIELLADDRGEVDGVGLIELDFLTYGRLVLAVHDRDH